VARVLLDALEVIERKHARHPLLKYVERSETPELRKIVSSIDEHLPLPAEQREAGWEPIVANLARATAGALSKQLSGDVSAR
jgi:hypothetical protein